MKLKAGGKAIIIAVVIGLAGFGANKAGVFDSKPDVPAASASVMVRPGIDVDVPIQSPTREASVPQEAVKETEQAPQPIGDVSSNRGLAAVIGAGQK